MKPLTLHPSYYKVFRETIDTMLYGDGPLSVDSRHYIALMAACRHQCQYMIDFHKTEFARVGGNRTWLEGLGKASQKIRSLDSLNRILAHQPWLLQTSHLQDLTQAPNPQNWSLSELLQAALILSHVHALCSFVHAVGITSSNKKDHHSPISTNGTSSPANDERFPSEQSDDVETLMATMEKLTQTVSECSMEEKQQQFLAINVQNSEISTIDETNCSSACLADCALYTSDMAFTYEDFAKRNETSAAPTFKIHDYSWDDQGYSVISQLCSHLTNAVDQKFHLTRNLTYYTMGEHHGVDTSKYRTAVWNYIQSLYGIRHDDYDYAEVNKLISRPMKTFIKTACCFPERMTDRLRSSVMVDFHHSERIHVNMMIMEARLQAAMLYLLRGIMRFMT